MCPMYVRAETRVVDVGCRYCVTERRKGKDKALPATPTERRDGGEI